MPKKTKIIFGGFFIYLLLVWGGKFIYPTPVFSAESDTSDLEKQIADRKDKIQDLQKQIDSIKGALQTKQLEKVTLQNQISIIDDRLKKTKLDIQATKLQLQTTELTLKETELEIVKKEEAIAKEQAAISELIRALDHTERSSFVTMLARGKTLSDFFLMQDAFELIDNKITAALVLVMVNKQELDGQKLKLSNIKNELEHSQTALLSKHEILQSQSNAKAQLLLQTKQSETKFQKLVADLKKQYSATEGEISSFERQVRARLKNKNVSVPTGDVHMSWPLASRTITASFHDPDYPFRHVFEHSGVDLRAAQGTPVKAAANGVVARAKNAGMGYSYVIIVHNNKISTLYGHLSKILVQEDEAVMAGDTIALSGGTPGTPGAGPFVTGAHLHFEVRSEGIPVNPLDYLP